MTKPDVFVGSGAYRPVTWERDSHVIVEAFDQYVLGRGKIDRITFHVHPNSHTATA
jgi:MarR-like DNA-binding transcriptional regulator SgrR of sgrS sRNA